MTQKTYNLIFFSKIIRICLFGVAFLCLTTGEKHSYAESAISLARPVDSTTILIEPSDIQPSPLPVGAWINVTSFGNCQLINATQLNCAWDKSVVLGGESVRIRYPNDFGVQTATLLLNETVIEPIQSEVRSANKSVTQNDYELSSPLEQFDLEFVFDSTLDPNTLNTSEIVIEVKRDTVSQVCTLNGAINTGAIGLNLGLRDFAEEQSRLELAQANLITDPLLSQTILDSVLPVRSATSLNELSAMGTDWVRFPVQPFQVDGGFETNWQNSGSATLEGYEYQIENLCDRGIGVVLVVVNNLVEGGQQLGEVPFNDFIQTYTDSVQTLAQEFPEVRRWEIWNEPDIDSNFRITDDQGNELPEIEKQANLENFVNLFDETRATIKAEIPNSTTIVGGLSNNWNNEGLAWLSELYDLGDFTNNFGSMGIHPYSYGGRSVNPEDYMTEPETNEPYSNQMEKVTEVMRVSGGSRRGIWVTEIGWETSERTEGIEINPCAVANNTIVTNSQQANYLYDAYKNLLDANETYQWEDPGNGSVFGVFWYRYDDIQIGDENFNPDCQANTSPAEAVADAGEIGVHTPIGITFQQQSRSLSERNVETSVTLNTVPINHWFGLKDVDQNPKTSYCEFVAVAMDFGNLDAPPSECEHLQPNPVPTTVDFSEQNGVSYSHNWLYFAAFSIVLATIITVERKRA